MPEAQQAAETFGLQIDTLMITLVAAVQAFFVLFFIISPIAGMLMGHAIKKRASLVIMTMLSLLAFNLAFIGTAYTLDTTTLNVTLNESSRLVIALAVAFGAAVFVLYTAALFLAEPGSLMEDPDHMPDLPASGLSFEQKRKERLQKRGKR